MTDETTGGPKMDEQRSSGAGFSAGRGVWEPVPQGGEYDTEQTGHMPLPKLADLGPRHGEDPLAAPARGIPPEAGEPQAWAPSPEPEAAGPAEEREQAGAPGTAGPAPGSAEPAAAPSPEPGHLEHPLASYVLRVNGANRPVTDAWLGESLLYVLRERLGLAGAKDGCEQGECGACSVQVDGRLVAACLVPAATAAGCDVRTVEGLSASGEPSDVQRALAESGAVQCGYCVPGIAMAVHDLLSGNHDPTELQIRQALSGNLCRCTGYSGVLAAVRKVVASRKAAEAATGGGEPHIPHQAGQAPGTTDGGGATQ